MRAICAALPFALALTLLVGCAKKEKAAEPNLLTNNNSGNPLTAPVDYLGAVKLSELVAKQTKKSSDVAVMQMHDNRQNLGALVIGRVRRRQGPRSERGVVLRVIKQR